MASTAKDRVDTQDQQSSDAEPAPDPDDIDQLEKTIAEQQSTLRNYRRVLKSLKDKSSAPRTVDDLSEISG